MADYIIYKFGKVGIVITWILLFITGAGFAYYASPSFINHQVHLWETIPGALLFAIFGIWLANKSVNDMIEYERSQDLPENDLLTQPCDFYYEEKSSGVGG